MNAIHSVDAMVVREMCRRCNYDKATLVEAYALLTSCKRTRVPNHQLDLTEFVSLNLIDGLNFDDAMCMNINTFTRLEKLIQSVLKQSKSFELVCIHDAFKSHANNVQTVRYWYKEILAELADSHTMQSILRQIYNNPYLTLQRASEDLGNLIRNSNYGIA